METICWFCGKRIRPGKATNIHHVLPRRYLKGRDTDRGNLLVLVHIRCHTRFNREWDRCDMPFPLYIVLMHAVQFGFGIYAPEEPHGRTTDQRTPRLARRELPVLPALPERAGPSTKTSP